MYKIDQNLTITLHQRQLEVLTNLIQLAHNQQLQEKGGNKIKQQAQTLVLVNLIYLKALEIKMHYKVLLHNIKQQQEFQIQLHCIYLLTCQIQHQQLMMIHPQVY